MRHQAASDDFDYDRYFWTGKKVLLRGLSVGDAEAAYVASLDSTARQLLQLGIELPTSVEALRILRCLAKEALNIQLSWLWEVITLRVIYP